MNAFAHKAQGFLGVYLKRNIIFQFLFGIASGLPLALTASTLTVWLSEAGVSKTSIGIFAAVAMPYSLKFLWAPLLDGITLTRFGKRRGWMILSQLAIAFSMVLMAFSNPTETPAFTAIAALLLAFCSATHDIAKDAYRVEILEPEEQGAGIASFVLGYRVGMIISTAGALYLATYTGWQNTYLLLACLLFTLIVPVLFAKEPASYRAIDKLNPNDITLSRQPNIEKAHNMVLQQQMPHGLTPWLSHYVAQPFGEFLQRPNAIAIILLILLYRMTDAFLGTMANPFYLELGFTKTQIADVVKLFGLIATLVGSMLGGAIVYRLGIYRSLWIGGIVAALSNLMFVWQSYQGANIYALMVTISTDNLSVGVATAAFIAYMGVLCNREFTATQFALLSSLSAVGRTWLATPTGYAAEHLGWAGFFVLSSAVMIPGLILLWWLKDSILKASEPPAEATLK